MWFSVVYSLIDNDTRHRSGQNLLRTRSAAPRESRTFWLLWWCVSLSIRLYTTLNHIRFVFNHNIKETKSLSWPLKTPTRIWKCTRCIMQMICLYASDFSFKNFCKLAYINMQKEVVIDKSTYHEKPYFDLFFTTQYQRQRKWFFSERELKKALRDTLTRAAWYGLLFTTAN